MDSKDESWPGGNRSGGLQRPTIRGTDNEVDQRPLPTASVEPVLSIRGASLEWLGQLLDRDGTADSGDVRGKYVFDC